MNDDQYALESGLLDVGGGHQIYFQQWGNKDAEPIFFLHGGPGSGCKDKHKAAFDPKKHLVIFHDQRGCGKSTPFGKLEHNTTQDLIADIEKLREKFGFEKISLFGGSWGSALALAYAIEHPDRVNKMLINGIYTGTKKESDYIQLGGLSTHFPESWQQYIEVVPEDQRDNTVRYYFEKMQSEDIEEASEHVRRWVINESAASSIDPDMSSNAIANQEIDDSTLSLALLEAHYFINDCFMPDRYILNSADKLKNIPIVMVQGRFDHVCPPETAYALAEAIGKNCHLHIVPSNHAREGALRESIRAYTWALFG
ncbi:prolyl aminopeptidase [Candidatus Saccharibacteria bacterium]|nr:prolyl aminopeptidase [Candidatus Saccharibacteria bacterium]